MRRASDSLRSAQATTRAPSTPAYVFKRLCPTRPVPMMPTRMSPPLPSWNRMVSAVEERADTFAEPRLEGTPGIGQRRHLIGLVGRRHLQGVTHAVDEKDMRVGARPGERSRIGDRDLLVGGSLCDERRRAQLGKLDSRVV